MKIVVLFSALSGMTDAPRGIFLVGAGLAPARTLGGICNAAAKHRRMYNPTKSISKPAKPLFAKSALNRTANATLFSPYSIILANKEISADAKEINNVITN